jgi:DNA-binding transcriptional regulator GbsR (MarR family)
MTSPTEAVTPPAFEGLDAPLRSQLQTFEVFFKTVGFKRIHGRVWGLLVLAGQPLSSKEVGTELAISLGATSTTLHELAEWGAITSSFDSTRRCHLHAPVGNTLSIVATVLRRREQVIFGQFKQNATRTLDYVRERYGERDPRALSLRSIISSCEIAEAVIELVLSSVTSALGDSESLLSKAIHTAFKVGIGVPAKLIAAGAKKGKRAALVEPKDAPEERDA